MDKKVYIIAEAGVNHNGSFERAIQLVDEAKKAGVDCVKFQTFKTELLVSQKAQMAEYQKQATGTDESQFEMLKRLELSFDEHRRLAEYCSSVGIDYCSTPFDGQSFKLLAELNVPFWKVPSGDVTNTPYLRLISANPKPVILSTGMASMAEIGFALSVLEDGGIPKDTITVLHCNTEYPTPMEDVNLLAMNTIAEAFQVRVGYSDHTQGIEVPIAAVAMGACVIEKHFTLDRGLPGPDHKSSLEPLELKAMVSAVRNIERALGSKEKKPSKSEAKNRTAARKSIVAVGHINAGDVFSESNLGVKRPGNGLSPIHWDAVIGRVADRNYDPDEMV